ncbi:HEAT repeat domain-containing protein [Pseudoalteromonas luteoviolacea]|uniref:Vitellogenin domain-containing protein n=1 Tax=Pseudoalteromonas luteoviolacea S4060-1 TaxID=1365257 RepID=A0A167PD08_9GAMM|nr:hypothetical protein [Pseudoalteromonas luteoviolacea]KZN70370.1 hypothetical protein N478_00270 [Pseudoalteromonas luteoviolacea S4060-1]
MKKITIIAIFVIAVSAFLVLKDSDSKPSVQVTYTASESMQPMHKDNQEYGYQVEIHSAVLSEKGTAITFSDLSWQMYFKPKTEGASDLVAMLTNIQFTSDNKAQEMPTQLPFYMTYDDGQFTKLNLLGLGEQHTLSVLPKVLDLMSYSLSAALTFEDAQGVKTYRYTQKDNAVSRTRINTASNPEREEEEQWQLTLNDNGSILVGIRELNYHNQQVWQQGGQHYDVVQSVFVRPIDFSSFDYIGWNNNQNATVSTAKLEAKQVYDITDENLLSHLTELKSSLDTDLAAQLGKYLLANQDQNEIKSLLMNHVRLNSALIYALQKAQTPQAEQMLSDLMSDEELGQQVRQKIVMALGRFENATNIAFSSLQTVADNAENTALSNMAMLSIGTMNRFSPMQSQQVAGFLNTKLSDPAQLPTAILAIANSKNPELVEKLPNYLHHSDTQVRNNTIKSLAHKTEYQDQVIASLVRAPHVTTIDSFTRVYKQANYKLSESNVDRLQALYHEQNNPLIKKRLAVILDI